MSGRTNATNRGSKRHSSGRASRRSFAISALLGPALAVACASPPSAEGHWILRELDGSKVDQLQTLTLQNDGTRVSGNAGCNQFQGPASIHAGRMSVGALASTRKMCEPELMEDEQRYLAALERVQQIRVTDTELVLDDINGATILVFVRDLP
jgi:heat shock protein HslJ